MRLASDGTCGRYGETCGRSCDAAGLQSTSVPGLARSGERQGGAVACSSTIPTRGRQSLRPFVDLNQGCKEQDEQCLSPSRFGQTKPNSIMFSMQLRRVWDAVLGRRHILGSAGGRTAPPAGNAPSGCKEQINHKLSLAGFGQTKPNSTMFSMQFSRVCDAA